MRNILLRLGQTAFVLVAVVLHWFLDHVVVVLPTVAVDAISRRVFQWTGNGYRFKEFQTFWNKEPESTEEE